MATMFVYALSIKGPPIYVGVSNNPGVRLVTHYRNNYRDMRKEMEQIKSFSEIEMRILEVLKNKTIKCDQYTSQQEAYWINKYLLDGHKLCNVNIKKCSRVPIKYYKQIKEHGTQKRKEIRLKAIRRENIPCLRKRS